MIAPGAHAPVTPLTHPTQPPYTACIRIMSKARNRLPHFLTDNPVPPSVSALAEFYREEFIKHHRCLQEQREYYSAQAIDSVEAALLRAIAEVDRLSEFANAEQLVASLLREFDVVTGLSGWSDPHQVH